MMPDPNAGQGTTPQGSTSNVPDPTSGSVIVAAPPAQPKVKRQPRGAKPVVTAAPIVTPTATPGIALPILSMLTNWRASRRKPKAAKGHKSFHQYLEMILGPMGIIFAVSMAVKSSYFWTLHLLDYTKLAAPAPDIINATTGLAIAFSLEVIGMAAAGVAYRAVMAKYTVALKDNLKKEAKKATERQFLVKFWVNLVFAILGMGGSIFALLTFAGDHVQGRGDSIAGELVTAIALQIGGLYLAVFYEPTRTNPLTGLKDSIWGSIGTAFNAFGNKLADGTISNEEIGAMQKVMDPEERVILDTLRKRVGVDELWDTGAIANFLMNAARWDAEKQADQYEAQQRNVANKMRRVKDEPEWDIAPKEKGRGSVMPAALAIRLFLPEIKSAQSTGMIFVHVRKMKPVPATPGQNRNGTASVSNQQANGTGAAANAPNVAGVAP